MKWYNSQTLVILFTFQKKFSFGLGAIRTKIMQPCSHVLLFEEEVTRTHFRPKVCNLLPHNFLSEDFFEML